MLLRMSWVNNLNQKDGLALKNNYKGWEDKKTLDVDMLHHMPQAQLEAERARLVAELKAELAQEQRALPDPDVIDVEPE